MERTVNIMRIKLLATATNFTKILLKVCHFAKKTYFALTS